MRRTSAPAWKDWSKAIFLTDLEAFSGFSATCAVGCHEKDAVRFQHEDEKVGCSACLPTFVDTLQASCICNGSLPSLMDPARLASTYGSRQWGRQGP